MTFPVIKKTSRIERIFIFAALIAFGYILSTLVSVIFAAMCKNMHNLNTLRMTLMSSQFLTFIIPPLLYPILVKDKPFQYLNLNKTSPWFFLIGFVMMYAILPLNNIFAEWNANLSLPESMKNVEKIMKILQEQATATTEKLLNVDNISGLLINLLMIAGMAAFGEELLFRSIIQKFLLNVCKNVHIGIFIAAFIFSFVHFEFYGFLPRMVLGILLGYMFYYSGSIWVPMLMHFTNNATAVVIYYLNNIGVTNIDVESFGTTNFTLLLINIIIMAALFYFTIKLRNKTSD